jgi:Mn-containing catalase
MLYSVSEERNMFLSINKLPNNIPKGDKPNPKAAQALQEGLGGQFGETRTMMQYSEYEL